MESLNRMALELIDEALDFAEELNVGAYELENQATVIDFGVEFDGGIEAGILLAEIQTGGLATIQTRMGAVGDAPIPLVELTCDHPGVALLCSQKADWDISMEGFEGVGAGPARALVGNGSEFDRVGYHDAFDFAVLSIQADGLPTESVADVVATRTGVETSAVFLPTFAPGSVVGNVTTAARAAEFAVFRLVELGYDPLDVLTVTGSAPVTSTGDGQAIEALTYAGQVHLVVREDFESFDEVPSQRFTENGSPSGGRGEAAGENPGKETTAPSAPAQVTIDVVNGKTHVFGRRNDEMLAQYFSR